MRARLLVAIAALSVTLLAGCAGARPPETPQASEGGMMGGDGASNGEAMVRGVIARSDEATIVVGSSEASGGVRVARVTAPADGWIVARSIAETGNVFGSARIRRGESRDVKIPLASLDGRKVRLSLHVDRGRKNELEFDPARVERSHDRAVYVDRKPIEAFSELMDFGVESQPHAMQLWVEDQEVTQDVLHIRQLIVPRPSWLVVNSVEGGVRGRSLAVRGVNGEQFEFDVPIERSALTDEVIVTLIADDGEVGRFEYDDRDPLGSADQPYTLGGTVVSQRVRVK